jgi:hypothetical protein
MIQVRVAILLSLSATLAGCTLSDPLPENYYDGTIKIAGGSAPSVPQVTYTASGVSFSFTASVDPETGAEVPTYLVYAYAGLTDTYYQTRNISAIISTPATRGFSFSGTSGSVYTVVVTGSDGNRESAVTDQNKIVFTVP